MFLLRFLFSFFLSCETQRKEQSETNVVATNKQTTTAVKTEQNYSVCLDVLQEIIESNSECTALIKHMRGKLVNYTFQIDSFSMLSRTFPQDSLIVYEVILTEK